MCTVVYVASDYPLPLMAWDENNRGLHVQELRDHEQPVRRHFAKPHVYYVGSSTFCGCGFQYNESLEYGLADEEGPELEESRQSRRQLAEFISLALQHQRQVELFSCWDGDQGEEPEFWDHLRPEDLVTGRTYFREREFLIISEHPS